MKRTTLITLLFYCVTFTATAQSAATYTVDKTKSTINWVAKKVVGGHEGTINIKEGTVNVSDNKVTGGSFVIDMPSLKCTDAERLTGHLKNEDFFDVEKFPTSTFVITKIDHTKKEPIITGKLTIKGITKDISFPASLSANDTKVEAKATVKVNRLDYDIRYRSSSFFADLGNRAIEDQFTLNISLTATK
ncbi:YceI family protein [Sphingobacterium lumbrici]|uniref:YceI family protein n=1 Tax=Sphingobacterium lumbrici TaxID=2559600 RepID=UPI0015E356A9|nr:YceI family protein [Sphingobacterium lumbrici]